MKMEGERERGSRTLLFQNGTLGRGMIMNGPSFFHSPPPLSGFTGELLFWTSLRAYDLNDNFLAAAGGKFACVASPLLELPSFFHLHFCVCHPVIHTRALTDEAPESRQRAPSHVKSPPPPSSDGLCPIHTHTCTMSHALQSLCVSPLSLLSHKQTFCFVPFPSSFPDTFRENGL